jgi:hypothetical protein
VIKYIEENITAEEYLYSYISSNFVVRYKTGYIDKIGNTNHRNIIYGQNVFDWKGIVFDRNTTPDYPWNIQWDLGKNGVYPNEITRVKEAGKCYILFSHINVTDFEYGLDKLREAGTVTLMMNILDTYLYYFRAHK